MSDFTHKFVICFATDSQAKNISEILRSHVVQASTRTFHEHVKAAIDMKDGAAGALQDTSALTPTGKQTYEMLGLIDSGGNLTQHGREFMEEFGPGGNYGKTSG